VVDPRLQFIAAEIALGMTLARVAETAYSMQHDAHGDEALKKARTAYDSAVKFSAQLKPAEAKRFRMQLQELETLVNTVRRPTT
jgi:thiamine biosynthesis protein ThiC